jgi:predicted membrane protein
MKHKILRVALVAAGIQIVAALAGLLISNKMKRGDESSDDFQVAAVLGGRKFQSKATNLRSGSVIATMGGVDLDLRDATLDPDGATLDLRATMGGAQITVPPDWAVDVEVEGVAGGFDVDVTPTEELPEDAPKLHIHAVACMGGGKVTSDAS